MSIRRPSRLAVNYGHDLNHGRKAWYLCAPGKRQGLRWVDMMSGQLASLVGTTLGRNGTLATLGSVGATGGAFAAITVPAVASTDDYAWVITHRPTTWPGTFTCLLGGNNDWSLSFDTSGNLTFQTGTILGFWGSGGGMTAGQWWQTVITRIAGTSWAWVNGVQITVSTGGAPATATAAAGTVNFGDRFANSSGSFYDGLYGEISFYSKRGLTPSEVGNLYEESLNGYQGTLLRGSRTWFLNAGATAFTLVAGKGTFTLTGDTAGLKSARKLASGKGTFTLTGDAAGLEAGHKVASGKGTFTLTGDAAGLKSARKLASGKGTFTLTGEAATLTGPGIFTLAAGAGSFSLTGQPATLTGPAPPPTPTITGGASGGGIALQWMERELKKQQRKSQVIDVRGKPARLTVQVLSPAVETLPRRPIPYLYSPVVTAMSRMNVKPVVIRWWEQVQQERRFEGMLTAHLKRQAEEIWLMTRD